MADVDEKEHALLSNEDFDELLDILAGTHSADATVALRSLIEMDVPIVVDTGKSPVENLLDNAKRIPLTIAQATLAASVALDIATLADAVGLDAYDVAEAIGLL